MQSKTSAPEVKQIIKIITTILIFIGIINNTFAVKETSNINWERASISKVYDKNKKKLHFLVQFKISEKPTLDYEFYFKILTSERKRTCDGEFTYTENAIYTVCSVNISDTKILDEKINIFFEVENLTNDETELEIYRSYNILKNTSNFNENDFGIISLKNDDGTFFNIKNYEKNRNIFLDKLDKIKEDGFDGVIVDYIDIYDKRSEIGFQIYRGDMQDFLIWLSEEANKKGMFLIQKNAPELSRNIEKYFDGALIEEAFYKDFSTDFSNYIKEDKKVFNIEYIENTTQENFLENICPKSEKLGYISILKNKETGDFIDCNFIAKTEVEAEDEIEEKESENIQEMYLKVEKIISDYLENKENKLEIINLLLEKVDKIKTEEIRKLEIIEVLKEVLLEKKNKY